MSTHFLMARIAIIADAALQALPNADATPAQQRLHQALALVVKLPFRTASLVQTTVHMHSLHTRIRSTKP